ncbi:hypothetical protein Emed_005392 [Eimeria media]
MPAGNHNPTTAGGCGPQLICGPEELASHRRKKLHEEDLPTIKLGEAYKYLGIKDALETSLHQNQILSIMSRVRKDAAKILRSALLPWQNLDVLRTFVLSRLDYHLWHCYPYKRDLIAFDSYMRNALKAAFKLPKGVTKNALFHRPVANGGLGCSLIQAVAAATQKGHGMRMLNCPDNIVRAVAEGQLLQTIRKRFTYTPDDTSSDKEASVAFLNISSDRLELIKKLKQRIAAQQYEQCKNKTDQGKTMGYQSADSKAFLRGPTELNPADVYFVLKARTAQVPTRSSLLKIKAVPSLRCRHCSADAETLAHALNHCRHHMDSTIKERHDSVSQKIPAAIRSTSKNLLQTLAVDNRPEGLDTQLRPDLILPDDTARTIAIVDLAIAYEGFHKNEFKEARMRKQEKYQELKGRYESRGFRVTLDALVYGSLGCTDKENEKVLKQDLGNTNTKTIRSLQRSISLECVRHSRKIWKYHVADDGSLPPARGRSSAGKQD